jgi:hypothetical protein
MIELLKQRLRSKTYWAAMLGAGLVILDAQSGFISGFLPAQYRGYAVMAWPLVMVSLREVTNAALAEK